MERLYIRPCAGVILCCGDKLLMHHRAETSRFMPGRWSSVGGHIERDEIGDPHRAALRELFEESGIPAEAVRGFQLRYIKLEASRRQLIAAFDYEAYVDQEIELGCSEEGSAHWVERDRVMDLPLMPTSRFMMEHYCGSADDDTVYFGYDDGNGPRWRATGERGLGRFALAAQYGEQDWDIEWLEGAAMSIRDGITHLEVTARRDSPQTEAPYIDVAIGGERMRFAWPGYGHE